MNKQIILASILYLHCMPPFHFSPITFWILNHLDNIFIFGIFN